MLPNLPNRENCTGCSACYNCCTHGAITMDKDNEGFLVPIIDEHKCKGCGLCVNKCPVLNVPTFSKSEKQIYAAYNLNKSQHQKSASGGIFSAFGNYFYSKENGVVCASLFDTSLKLKFAISTRKEDLEKLRGSKYVQSEVGLIYKEIRKLLHENKEVFFIGTPCQVAGLRSYLGKEYENLFLIDLVCHGVPSPELFKDYLSSIGVDNKHKYENYFFRNQKDSTYFISSVKPQRGKVINIPVSQHSYICAYLKGWIHRESCYNCKFTGNHRQGDCTISDFWGILANKTSFGSSKEMGVSMIMTNTSKGERILDKIKNQLYIERKTFEEALIDNHNLIRPDVRPQERDYIYKELRVLSPEEFMIKYQCKIYTPTPLLTRIINKMKRIINCK